MSVTFVENDNDCETIDADVLRWQSILNEHDPRIEIVKVENGIHHSLYKLEKKSLLHRESLERLLSTHFTPRYSLVQCNYKFPVEKGERRILQMTLAIKREAYPLKRDKKWFVIFLFILSLGILCGYAYVTRV